MTKNVTFSPLIALTELEAKTGHRYTYKEIADKANWSRQAVRSVLTQKPSRVDVETLGKLLCFFEKEGLPVSVEDFFTVKSTEDAPTP
jgi:hypothetical protein